MTAKSAIITTAGRNLHARPAPHLRPKSVQTESGALLQRPRAALERRCSEPYSDLPAIVARGGRKYGPMNPTRTLPLSATFAGSRNVGKIGVLSPIRTLPLSARLSGAGATLSTVIFVT